VVRSDVRHSTIGKALLRLVKRSGPTVVRRFHDTPDADPRDLVERYESNESDIREYMKRKFLRFKSGKQSESFGATADFDRYIDWAAGKRKNSFSLSRLSRRFRCAAGIDDRGLEGAGESARCRTIVVEVFLAERLVREPSG